MSITVTKRDGREEEFENEKISNSIMEAAMKVGGEDADLADELADMLEDMLNSNGVEEVEASELQGMVEKLLIEEGHAQTAKEYILYAAERDKVRELDSDLMRSYEEISFSSGAESDTKRENANINSETAMGTMLKYGSEGAKKFNLLRIISPDVAEAHKVGDIHIHDLDFFKLTETCCQIPLASLFKGGFNTGHGFLRQPGNIRSAGALAAITIQSNQNDQHGGQSIPMFDYYLGPYVALSYLKNIAHVCETKFELNKQQYQELKDELKTLWDVDDKQHIMNEDGYKSIESIVRNKLDKFKVKYSDKRIKKTFEAAYNDTYEETFQSMEAFIHNLNTMHSRAGRRANMVEVPVTWETLCAAV